jgi:hypothetical protein
MSEVKKPVAKKSTGKGRTKPKKSGARKPAQKKSVKSNPIDQALTLVAKKFVKAGGTKLLLKVLILITLVKSIYQNWSKLWLN